MAALIVDTNILLDVYTQDQKWEERSAAAIAAAADVAVLVINPIIYAELSVVEEKIEELDQSLGTEELPGGEKGASTGPQCGIVLDWG